MENKSLHDNINVKGKWIYKPLREKESKKYKTMIAIKITDTTEYSVRVEPGTFAMQSERHTTTPPDRMRSQGVEQSHDCNYAR